MKLKNKRLLFILLSLLILFAGFGLAYRYLPLDRLIHLSSDAEDVFADTLRDQQLPPNTLYLDFEVAPGNPVPKSLVKGEAHSGEYASRAFGKNSFAFQVERKAGEIGLENLTKVGLSAWLYLYPGDNEVNANLVLAAFNDAGVNICWKSRHVSGPEIPRGKWFKISGEVDLREFTFQPGNRIQIYFWNNSDNDILVDDYRIVFGTSPSRRGDSALVNMTRPEGYRKLFNLPPFSTKYFIARPAVFDNQDQSGNKLPAGIRPADVLLGGYFLDNPSRLDALLVVPPAGNLWMAIYCPRIERFQQYQVRLPESPFQNIDPQNLYAGRFSGAPEKELLVITSSTATLLEFGWQGEACREGSSVNGKILWKGTIPELTGSDSDTLFRLACGDFNGDNRTELLVTTVHGWTMLGYDPQGPHPWKKLASGSGALVPVVQQEVRALPAMHTGRFMQGIRYDQVLVIPETPSAEYNLLRWNSATKHFESCFTGKYKGGGITIGFDTLEATDRFFTGQFEGGTVTQVLRLNRNWRFDLKQISFNDSTFEIRHMVDFKGYEKDYNPKYYELFVPVTGRFLHPGQDLMLIISSNCREWDLYGKKCREAENHPSLPDRINLYTLKPYEH